MIYHYSHNKGWKSSQYGSALFLLVVFCFMVGAQATIYARPHIKISSDELDIASELQVRYNNSEYRNRASSRSTQTNGSLNVLTPSELLAIYDIPSVSTAGAGQIIAVVDAFGASTAESDLSYFSSFFNLPTCTTNNGCFSKVNQTGGTDYPPDDKDWGSEVNLDIQTIHTVAPGAKILLVVASSASLDDLFTAVTYAKNHANYVSMSFGAPENVQVTTFESTIFANSPVSFFASTGDTGGHVEYPSSSPSVIAVGGTSVFTTSTFAFVSEQGWADSGGGCSQFFRAPALQSTLPSYVSVGCNGFRAVPDLAMDANPASGVFLYYSFGCNSPPKCFFSAGGTSLAAPIAAGRAAILQTLVDVTDAYDGSIQYRDITTGNNGFPARPGFDLITGQGSWIGNHNVPL